MLHKEMSSNRRLRLVAAAAMAAAASLLPVVVVVVVVDASSFGPGRPPTATTRTTPRAATRDDGRRRQQAGGTAPSPPLFSPRGGGGGGGDGDDDGGDDAAASADGGGSGGGKNYADGASFEITMDRDGGGKVKVDVATANGGGGGIGDMIDAARERYAASSSSSAALTALSTAAGGRRGGGATTSTSSSSMSSSSSHISSRFPVSPSELPHFMSMSFMMFLFIYVFTTVRDTKDTLVVSNCGAEAIPFLKLYGVMPCATAFIVAYSKLSDVLDKKVLFYVTLVPFFVFYGVFAFVLFPNRDVLHFVPSGDGGVVGATSAAMNLLRYWSFSLYFVVSELWASAGVPLLFWQVSRREAKTMCNIARGVNASPHLHFASALSTILKVLPEDGMKTIPSTPVFACSELG